MGVPEAAEKGVVPAQRSGDSDKAAEATPEQKPDAPAGAEAAREPAGKAAPAAAAPAAAAPAAAAPAAAAPAAAAPAEAKGTGSEDKAAASKDAVAKDGGKTTDGPGKDAPSPGGEKPKDGPADDSPAKGALDKTAVDKTAVDKAAADKAAAAPVPPAGKKAARLRPLAAVGRGSRATAAWARGPVGRVILPGLVVLGLVVLAGTSGAYLVPRALEAAAPTATPTFTDQSAAPSAGWSDPAAPGAPGVTGAPGIPGATTTAVPPTGTLPATGLPTVQPTATGARPADALASWAQQVGTRVGIPVVAVQAYGYAELVTARTTPSCHLSWTTLAAIGKVESGHGSHEGAVLGVDGVTQPSIRGLPLDGQGGRQLIRDSDGGTLDGDTTYDRAVGPMQFIPATWQASAIDADNNGVKDPNDIDDAAMTAAAYLCRNGRDLARADSWWDAVLTYNDVRQYAQDVFTAANDYGLRSRA